MLLHDLWVHPTHITKPQGMASRRSEIVSCTHLYTSDDSRVVGDHIDNKTHHRRPHDGVLAAWADAMRAPANAPVVHGDKEKPELTRQYNEGYKVDLAEPHAGPGGCDEVNEVKLWTPLLKTSSPGVGNASSGGTRPPPLATPTPSAAPRRKRAA